MSGHSKWATTKRQKAAIDARRGQQFTKLTNAIILAARRGGGDPTTNGGLRFAIDQARAANMPRNNIDRAIKRGTGELTGEMIEEFTYEAVGPGGSAFIIEGLTDKKTRTLSDLRQLLGQHGVRLAESGSQAWQFKRVGLVRVPFKTNQLEQAQLDMIEAGAEDVVVSQAELIVTTKPNDVGQVRAELARRGYEPSQPELVYRATTKLELAAADVTNARAAKQALEEHDDVQQVAVNF